ncbi:hypothetical protein JCM8097_003651 [Rhodosporidiobolus ruineniae]
MAVIFDLPPELLGLVLSHVDAFPTLNALVRSHSTFHSIYQSYAEHLCRFICIRTGLAEPKTSGAAAALKKEGPWADKTFDDKLDEEELKEVVKAQGTMLGFDEIRSWQDYARARHRADQNWLHGRTRQGVILPNLAGGINVMAIGGGQDFGRYLWRFKLDVAARAIIATGIASATYAYTTTGACAWSCAIPMQPYGHVELSDGYISLAFGDSFAVLRRNDLSVQASSESGPSPRALGAARFQRTSRGHTLGYAMDDIFSTANQGTASKLRAPILLGVTRDASEVHRWDIHKRELCVQLLPVFADPDQLDEGEVTYVELDSRSIFIAGQHSITLWQGLPFSPTPPGQASSPADAVYRTWPPAPPPHFALVAPLVSHEAHYRDPQKHVRWSAVHHDGRDRHLVAISERGTEDGRAKMMWTVDYQNSIWGDNQEVLEQKTVVLVSEHADLVQLAVENDRAVFVASTDSAGISLWLVNLREFEDHADFAQDPPKPICLVPFLPTLVDPSRIEFTSTEIFLPALRSLLRSSPSALPTDADADDYLSDADDPAALYEYALASVPEGKMPLPFKWQTLDGQTLVDYTAFAVDWATEARRLEEDERAPDPTVAEAARVETDVGEVADMKRAWKAVLDRFEDDETRLPYGASDAFLVLRFDEEKDNPVLEAVVVGEAEQE